MKVPKVMDNAYIICNPWVIPFEYYYIGYVKL